MVTKNSAFFYSNWRFKMELTRIGFYCFVCGEF